MKTKLGLHIKTGSRNGYGNVARHAPIVRVVDEFGALDDLPDGAVAILRTTKYYFDAPNDLDKQTEADAFLWGQSWAKSIELALRDALDRHASRLRLFVQVLNESTGGDNLNAIKNAVEFERGAATHFNMKGVALAHLSLANDSPLFDLWAQHVAPFLIDSAKLGNIYARHVYGGAHPAATSQYLTNADGTANHVAVSRVFKEANFFRSQNAFVPIALVECGQGGGEIAPNLEDYARFDALCLREDMIWGFCCWTYGDWQGSNTPNLQSISADLDAYLSARERAEYKTGDSSTPPAEGSDARVPYARKFYLFPQDMAFEDAAPIIREFWDERPTFGKSADDAGIGRGLKSKKVIAFDPETWGTDDALEAFYARYYPDAQFEARSTKSDPMEGVKLGFLLDRPYMYTSLFNAPRQYANKLHEGIDADVFEAGDSRALVLATRAGVVTFAGTTGDGYGLQVRVKHATDDGKYIFFTRYCHLDYIRVDEGDFVLQGDAVGEIGDTGNVTGEHLHFNLETPGTGLSGYYVADVRDPKPFLPAPPTAPTFEARFGIHANASPGDISEAEFELYYKIKPNVIKFLNAHSGTSIERAAVAFPDAVFIIRAFLDFGGRAISPAQFVQYTIDDTKRAIEALVPHVAPEQILVELHNEPNLYAEGFGSAWASASAFDTWLLEVLRLYRTLIPNVRYMFPGLSPGDSIANVRVSDAQFLSQTTKSVAACDAIGVHVYWSNAFPYETAANSGLSLLARYRSTFANRELWVTEASNNGVASAQQKAAEYVRFWRDCSRMNVRGVTFFVASALDGAFDNEVWIKNGQSVGIAEGVANR